MTKVINAVKTKDFDTIEGKACIQYWNDAFWTNDSSYCRNCRSTVNIEGGHVIGKVNNVYHICITPLCKKCNDERDLLPSFDVIEDDLVVVPPYQEEKLFAMHENQIQKIKLIKETIANFWGE